MRTTTTVQMSTAVSIMQYRRCTRRHMHGYRVDVSARTTACFYDHNLVLIAHSAAAAYEHLTMSMAARTTVLEPCSAVQRRALGPHKTDRGAIPQDQSAGGQAVESRRAEGPWNPPAAGR